MANIIDFSNTTPSAPGGATNVTWQCDPATGKISASYIGSSGGGTPGVLYPMPAAPAVTQSTGWAGYSFFVKLSGRRFNFFNATWRVGLIMAPGANTTLTAIKILKTLKDDLVVISSTAVTFSASAAPVLTPGFHKSDVITLTPDGDHDFWVAVHVSISTSNTEVYGWIQTNATDLFGGYISGDFTATSPIPAGSLTVQFNMIEQILSS